MSADRKRLIIFLAEQHREAVRNGRTMPPEFFDIVALIADPAPSCTETQNGGPEPPTCDRAHVDEHLLLTAGQTATLLNVSLRTVKNMTADGRLVRVDLGTRSVRYRRADVEALAAGVGTFRARVIAKSTGSDPTPTGPPIDPASDRALDVALTGRKVRAGHLLTGRPTP